MALEAMGRCLIAAGNLNEAHRVYRNWAKTTAGSRTRPGISSA